MAFAEPPDATPPVPPPMEQSNDLFTPTHQSQKNIYSCIMFDSCTFRRFGEDDELGLLAGGVGAVDGFVDTGNDDGSVAGELSGGVDEVFVPRAMGKAVGVEQCGFSIA